MKTTIKSLQKDLNEVELLLGSETNRRVLAERGNENLGTQIASLNNIIHDLRSSEAHAREVIETARRCVQSAKQSIVEKRHQGHSVVGLEALLALNTCDQILGSR